MKRLSKAGLTALGLAALLGCETPESGAVADAALAAPVPAPPAPAPVEATVSLAAAPMDLGRDYETTWDYLRSKYDADGDGRVGREEYARSDRSWERLDRNHDGALDKEDFGGGPGGSREAMMRGFRAQRVVAEYFQDDPEPARLSREELQHAVAAYDRNRDGAVDHEEFAASAAARHTDTPGSAMMKRMMGQTDPWDALVAAVDGDKDGRLGRAEIDAFFADRDDGDGVWTLRAHGGGGGGSGRPMTGPAEGVTAPDFTLAPPDGGFPVSLSSFQGDRPVALIFGSYT